MPHFHCQGEANWFLERYFMDCIYNARDLTGFLFGMSSIACWIVAQVPQFITNIKRQRADALSPWFLAEWLMTLQHRRERLLRLPHQRLNPDDPLYRHAVRRPASAHEETDTILPSQQSSSRRSSGKAPRVLACLAVMLVLQSQWPLQQAVSLDRGWQGQVMGHSSNRHLLGIDTLAPASAKGSFQAMSNQARPDWVRTLGTGIGWSSSGFYLGSRLSQIWKNYSRHSAEGLSLAMFACAITANVCYGLGILIRAYSWDVIYSSAPWILGSLGTVSLDLVIFTQGIVYASRKRDNQEAPVPSEESQPLFAEVSNVHST